MSTYLPCPMCPVEIEVSDEDPDGSLTDLWDHLSVHAGFEATRNDLFIEAQSNAVTRP